MRLLLDTHILLWCLDGGDKLPDKTRQLILSADAVYASTVNIWEIVVKMSIGKLDIRVDASELIPAITQSGFELLPIKPEHTIKLVDLEDHHRDPFDRMLICQSIVEPLHLITHDPVVAKYNAHIIKV